MLEKCKKTCNLCNTRRIGLSPAVVIPTTTQSSFNVAENDTVLVHVGGDQGSDHDAGDDKAEVDTPRSFRHDTRPFWVSYM